MVYFVCALAIFRAVGKEESATGWALLVWLAFKLTVTVFFLIRQSRIQFLLRESLKAELKRLSVMRGPGFEHPERT